MFMFMRKFRKNFKGDSLIEVITAFAIVSIVGLITISGVVTSGRIKIQTNHIKNASYKADEALQKQSMYENMASDSVKIYNAADYDISSKSVISESAVPVLTKSASKFSASGADGGRTQGYKYYRMKVTEKPSDTPDNNSGGKGNFGMSGQWFVRIYLDPTVLLPDKFFLEVEFTSAFEGEGLASETDINFGKNGISSGYWQYGIRPNKIGYYRINDGNDIKKLSSDSSITFGKNVKVVSYLAEFDKDIDYQGFDVNLFWSTKTAYGLNFYIVNADKSDPDYGKRVLATDGSDAFSKITVYARTGDAVVKKVENGSAEYSGRDYSTYKADGYNWYGVNFPSSSQSMDYYKNYKNGNHNYLYDFDNSNYEGSNAGKYVYLWTKDNKSNSKWGDNYNTANRSTMLLLNKYSEGITVNSFRLSDTDMSYIRNFREYLRIEDKDMYEFYNTWIEYCKKNGMIDDEMGFDGKPVFAFYTWYILDNLEVNKKRIDKCFVGNDIKDYITFISTDRADACGVFVDKNCYFCINALYYWWKYDQNFLLNEFLDYTKTKNINIFDIKNGDSINGTSLVFYYRAFWLYYYIDIKGNSYTNPKDGKTYTNFKDLCDAMNQFEFRDTYLHFYGKDKLDSMKKNYDKFITDSNCSDSSKTVFNEYFNSIIEKSIIDPKDAIKNILDVSYKSNPNTYELTEITICIFDNAEYTKLKSWMSSLGVDFSSENRFKNTEYKDMMATAWKYYCLDIINYKNSLQYFPIWDGIVANNYNSINSFEDYYNYYKLSSDSAYRDKVLDFGQRILNLN